VTLTRQLPTLNRSIFISQPDLTETTALDFLHISRCNSEVPEVDAYRLVLILVSGCGLLKSMLVLNTVAGSLEALCQHLFLVFIFTLAMFMLLPPLLRY